MINQIMWLNYCTLFNLWLFVWLCLFCGYICCLIDFLYYPSMILTLNDYNWQQPIGNGILFVVTVWIFKCNDLILLLYFQWYWDCKITSWPYRTISTWIISIIHHLYYQKSQLYRDTIWCRSVTIMLQTHNYAQTI